MEDRVKLSIIDGAKFALEQVQYTASLDEDKPLEVWQDEVQKFLNYWDKVFLYGLKSVRKGYWNFVSKISHPTLVSEVKDTPGAVSDLMRSRVWLSTILNDNELENYLQIIKYETKLLSKFYRPNAIVRSISLMEDLISIACGQEKTLFSIHMDDICYRCNEIFVGPDNSSSYNKLFDVRFNWDESIRSRSSSVYSVRSTRSFVDNAIDRSPSVSRSFGNKSLFKKYADDDLGVNAEYLERLVTPSPSPSPRSQRCRTIDEGSTKETGPDFKIGTPEMQADSLIKEIEPHLQTFSTTQADDIFNELDLQSQSEVVSEQFLEVQLEDELCFDSNEIIDEPSKDSEQCTDEQIANLKENSDTLTHDLKAIIPDPQLPSSPNLAPPASEITISRKSASPLSSPLSSVGQSPQRVGSAAKDMKADTIPIQNINSPSGSNTSINSWMNNPDVLATSPGASLKRRKLKVARIDSEPQIDTSIVSVTIPRKETLDALSSFKDDFKDGSVLNELLDIRSEVSRYDKEDLSDVLEGVKMEESESSALTSSHALHDTPPPSEDDFLQFASSSPQEHSQSPNRSLLELLNESLDAPATDTAHQLHTVTMVTHSYHQPLGHSLSNTEPYSDEEITNENTIPVEEMIKPPSPIPSFESSAGSSYSSLSDKSHIDSEIEFLDDGEKPPPAPFVLFDQLGAAGLLDSETTGEELPKDDIMLEPYSVTDPYADSDDSEISETDHLGASLGRSVSPVRSSTILSGNMEEMDKSIENELSHASLDLRDQNTEIEEELEELRVLDCESGAALQSTVVSGHSAGHCTTAPHPLSTESGGDGTDYNVPRFASVSLDRDQAVVSPADNMKISWTMNLFNEDLHEEYRVMYRIWMKDEVGNLEVSYLLLTTVTTYLLDFEYAVKLRIALSSVTYGRGLNWQVLTLFYTVADGTTDQVDLITGCEAISRGIMEGFAVHTEHPVNWSMDESYSQQRLKYHVGAFVQKQQKFNLASIDNLHYCIVSWDPLKGDSVPSTNYPMTQGTLGLKEPTLFSYVWRDYYFILDNGKLSQFDTECSGVIKKEFTIIGSSSCRKMKRDETSKKYAFKFVSEEGDEVMMNCKDDNERDKWMSAICETAMEIPRTLDKTGAGLQCSVVVNEDYVIVLREGLKTAFTLAATMIQEITTISWFPEEEFCIVSIEATKRVWLLLFKDIYETNKFMEQVWERWSEMFQIKDPSMLFKRLSEDIPTPAYIPGNGDETQLPVTSESMLTRAKRAIRQYRRSWAKAPSRLSF